MPKTAVHKNRKPSLRKYEIWFAKDWLLPSPASDAMSAEKLKQGQFCILISAAANSRHHF
jgi:hypothetical protein